MNKITTFGEILLRLSTPDSQRISQSTSFNANYGGAEANVAVALASWGHSVQHITRLPENDLGNVVLQMLKKEEVLVNQIIKGGSRLGLYFLETGAGTRNPQVIYDRSHSAMAEIRPGMIDWNQVLDGVSWFHWSGITSAISQTAADTCLEGIEAATKKGITISVDLNYREKLWKYGKRPAEILPEMLKHCDYIFGGIDAPEKMFGIVPEGKSSTRGELLDTDIISIAEQMTSKFPKAQLFSSTLRWIRNTDHHQLQGMIYAKKEKEFYLSSIYDMPQMIDRIGGGDAFMAGLIHGLIKYSGDYQKITDFATASSVLKHYVHGDVSLAKLSEIENLMSGGTKEVNR